MSLQPTALMLPEDRKQLSNTGHTPLDWSTIRVKLGRYGRDVWRRGHAIAMDWFVWPLPDYDIWFFFQGRGWVRDVTGQVEELRAGSCLWLRPGDRFEFWQEEGGACLGDAYIHFELFDADGAPIPRSRIAGVPFLFETFDFKYFDLITQRIMSLLRNSPGEGIGQTRRLEAEFLMKCLLMDFEIGAQAQARQLQRGIELRHQRTIRKIISRIYEDPVCSGGIKALARSSGYSLDYFSRIFRSVTGSTPNAVLIAARLEKARSMLAAGDLTVAQVADELGYTSPFYFTRQFKQKTGMSPSQYRKGFRPGAPGEPASKARM